MAYSHKQAQKDAIKLFIRRKATHTKMGRLANAKKCDDKIKKLRDLLAL